MKVIEKNQNEKTGKRKGKHIGCHSRALLLLAVRKEEEEEEEEGSR